MYSEEIPLMMYVIAQGPYNGREHLITDKDKKVIELAIQHYTRHYINTIFVI